MFKGRKPEHEDRLPSLTLPGDVKERLQLHPETPPKRRPVGDSWKKFKPKAGSDPGGRVEAAPYEKDRDDPVGGYGPPMVHDVAGVSDRRHKLSLSPAFTEPSDEMPYARINSLLATNGMDSDRDALKEKQTNEHSEHLYEEITDKQTGKKSLLFRQNFFDRY